MKVKLSYFILYQSLGNEIEVIMNYLVIHNIFVSYKTLEHIFVLILSTKVIPKNHSVFTTLEIGRFELELTVFKPKFQMKSIKFF